MSAGYDAIVVGARCAGSPTAMLLARKGYRVLLLDRASFRATRCPVTSSTSRASHPSSAGAFCPRLRAPAAPTFELSRYMERA